MEVKERDGYYVFGVHVEDYMVDSTKFEKWIQWAGASEGWEVIEMARYST